MRRHAVQELVARRRTISVQQRQHSSHQNDEKPVERPSHVAVGIGIGIGAIGITAVSVLARDGQVVGLEADEQVDEDLGILLVQKAVSTYEHFVKVAV